MTEVSEFIDRLAAKAKEFDSLVASARERGVHWFEDLRPDVSDQTTVTPDASLRIAIERALKELGVPNSGYPAPVENAVRILKRALEDG